MKVLIADDQPIVVCGLRSFFAKHPDLGIEVAAEVSYGQDLAALCSSLSPDLVILELSLQGVNGLEAIRKVRRKQPQVQVIAFSRHADPVIAASALKEGVQAFLLKSSPLEEWFPALEAVRNGESYTDQHLRADNRMQDTPVRMQDAPLAKLGAACVLTRRESEILQLIVQGFSNKEIGRRLYISDQTVSVHRKNIMRKLGVCNTAGLVKAAFELGLMM